MKKGIKLLSVFLMLALMFCMTGVVLADTAAKVSVTVNNNVLSGVAAPVYSNGVILVPAKEFVEAMGGTFTCDRDALTGTVKLGENELIFRLDDNVAKLNGKYISAPAPMQLMGFRFMIPAEFTAKNLGSETYMHTYRNALTVFQPTGGNLIYKVSSGDTLWIIANIFGTTITSIKQLNKLSSDVLYVDQSLIIKSFTSFSTILPAVTSGNASVFKGPGFNYDAWGYLKPGVSISVVGKTGDWYKVITPVGNGYTHYTVTSVTQDTTDTASDSTYFTKNIPIDTSSDTISFSTYKVVNGDSIWSISLKVGVPDYELAQANGVVPTATLYAGQTLKVPVHNIPVKKTPGPQYGELLDWFKEAQYLFPIGKVGKFIDMETGKSFMAKRTMGANHSDTETLTAQDTQAMKDIFGGAWTWNRRPFYLEVDGRRYAISVAGMPHAGVDGQPFLQNVDNRSDNWGSGPNYDSIAGNGMDGHFDVYFLNCLRHVDNKIDPAHQFRVMLSAGMQ